MGYIVYMHLSPNGKRYIGITGRKVEKRWGNNGTEYRKNSHFYNAIQKYGWDNIEHIILKEGITKEEACELEKYYIQLYKTMDKRFGYNRSIGGEYNSGFHYKRSPEFIEYMRKLNTGKHPSLETRKKMSEHNCMHREEIRHRVSESLKKSGKRRAQKRLQTMKERYPSGIKQTEESNRKRSESMKGIPKSEQTKQRMRKPKSPEAIEHMRQAQILSHKARKLRMSYKDYLIMNGGR